MATNFESIKLNFKSSAYSTAVTQLESKMKELESARSEYDQRRSEIPQFWDGDARDEAYEVIGQNIENRSKGVHTALDTAGQPFRPDDPDYLAGFDRLMKSTSLVILDLKEIDPERHRQLTGKDNANILAMARHISDLGIPLWIRHVLVPGLTDDEEGLRRTADFIRSLKTVQRVEVLPYHTLGLFKWQKLGIPYPLPDAVPPTPEQVKRAEELLQVQRYPG